MKYRIWNVDRASYVVGEAMRLRAAMVVADAMELATGDRMVLKRLTA